MVDHSGGKRRGELAWHEVRDVFAGSLTVGRNERERFVRREASSTQIYRDVMSLLAAYDSSDISIEKITTDAALELLRASLRDVEH
ncbi:MAG: hypothetical protein AAFX44_05110 [Pseudomonadota bacterium]